VYDARVARHIGLIVSVLFFTACGKCMGSSSSEFGPQPPNLPPLMGEAPAHGIESARAVRTNGCADEGEWRSVMLRRDGCFATRGESSDGAVTTQTACTGCVDEEQVRTWFVALAETTRDQDEVSGRGTPVDDCWSVHVALRYGDGREVDDDSPAAVTLFDDLPELGPGTCDSAELR